MKTLNAAICLGSLAFVLSASDAAAAPISYTLSVTHNGATTVGDPRNVVGLQLVGNAVDYARSIDGLTVLLADATAAGTVLDAVEFSGFDEAVAPEAAIGTYRFTGVLFTSHVLAGTSELGAFVFDAVTFARAPEPGSLALLALGLVGVTASRRRMQSSGAPGVPVRT